MGTAIFCVGGHDGDGDKAERLLSKNGHIFAPPPDDETELPLRLDVEEEESSRQLREATRWTHKWRPRHIRCRISNSRRRSTRSAPSPSYSAAGGAGCGEGFDELHLSGLIPPASSPPSGHTNPTPFSDSQPAATFAPLSPTKSAADEGGDIGLAPSPSRTATHQVRDAVGDKGRNGGLAPVTTAH
uniref:Uncharacterized protein n=1 Tax=Oryza glumipatula TaxID=40148 RepID=A0A0D9Y690_9ORYZ